MSRTLQGQPSSWRLMLEHYLARPRVAKHNVARSVRLGLDELQARVFRHTGEQRPAASEEDRADNHLILVDNPCCVSCDTMEPLPKTIMSLPGRLFMVSISRGSSS